MPSIQTYHYIPKWVMLSTLQIQILQIALHAHADAHAHDHAQNVFVKSFMSNSYRFNNNISYWYGGVRGMYSSFEP